MLKKELMNELNNENHYTVPRYVLSYAKELGLDMDSLILLIYYLFCMKKNTPVKIVALIIILGIVASFIATPLMTIFSK